MAEKMEGSRSGGHPEVPGVRPRRLLGAYYTPDELALVMVRWALANNRGPVLDPSYGGCAFLDAAARVLSESDPASPGRLVYGVDINPLCADIVRQSERLVDANCVARDFLEASPLDLEGSPFTAIVGNPPYVRHHWITGDQRESARAIAADSTVPLPATASLWAYFLLHSLQFLADGGRLAMLVPEAILQADYAAPLREILAKRFGRSRLIYIRDRLFADTDEPVVAVACADFGECGDVWTEAVESVGDLESVLTDSNGRGRPCGPSTNGVRPADPDALTLLERIRNHDEVRRLADIATLRVGLVTGANKHFIRPQPELDALGLPRGVRHRIVPRTRWLKGLAFNRQDHNAFLDLGAAALVVHPASPADDRKVEPWIAEGRDWKVEQRYKCAQRDDWFRVELPPVPDAFATCTRVGSPLLVLNRAGCHCSNAIHRVNWGPDRPVAPEAVAVGFLTSAVSAWAELHGRRYGGGVLKMEPGTLQRLPVPLVSGAEDVFGEIDELLRGGAEEKARELADKRVLREGLGLEQHKIACLRQTRSRLMRWRQPSRATNGHA